jgi:hypothetical protein
MLKRNITNLLFITKGNKLIEQNLFNSYKYILIKKKTKKKIGKVTPIISIILYILLYLLFILFIKGFIFYPGHKYIYYYLIINM